MSAETNALPAAAGRSEATRSPAEDVARFRKYFPLVVEILVSVALAYGLAYYLIGPQLNSWLQGIYSLDPPPPLAPTEEYLLDCFIVRDASGSPLPEAQEAYQKIEEVILGHLRPAAGDRISYALFGTDTTPNPIQPPSADAASLAEQRRQAGTLREPTTDFARLFDRLREAIRDDRRTQRTARRANHADAIIILTDGIPDLSQQRRGCPQPDEEFIPPDVAEAFQALINSTYATHETISVRLVLMGAPLLCGPSIQQKWQDRLGSIVSGDTTFEVLSSSELLQNVESNLLKPLRRQPHVIVKLHDLKDQERSKLDRGEPFSAQYHAWSFLQAGELVIEQGALEDSTGQKIPLHAFKDPNFSPIESNNRAVISAPAPKNPQDLFGEPTSGSIYFMPVNGRTSPLSEFSPYKLWLTISPNTPYEIKSEPLEIAPCNHAAQKKVTQGKLWNACLLPATIGIIFLLGTIGWYATDNTKDERKKLWHNRCEAFVIRHCRRWIEAFLVVLVPMSLGVYCLERPKIVVVCIGLALSLILFMLTRLRDSQLRDSPTLLLLFFTVEFLLLPIVVGGAANGFY